VAQFLGKENSDDVLVKKGEAIALFVIKLVSADTKSLFSQLEKDKDRKIDDSKFGGVLGEMAILYCHFVDRIAFQHLGAERRNIFIDALFEQLTETLSMIHESTIERAQFCYSFLNINNERVAEYGNYKELIGGTDTGQKDSLFWEFGKKIAGIVVSEMDIVVIMYVMAICSESLTALLLPELFKE